MKLFLPLSLILAGVLPAAAAPSSSLPSASHKVIPSSAVRPTAAAPAPAAPAAPPAPTLTLDAYLAALASDVPLGKDEQTDVKAYYQDDGAKLQAILTDASLSPFEQTQQVDALRDSRNARIEALLNDVARSAQFLKLESEYRVALVELAAQGGLVPTSTPPNVPEPTATTPAQADQAVQARARTAKMDSAPGQ